MASVCFVSKMRWSLWLGYPGYSSMRAGRLLRRTSPPSGYGAKLLLPPERKKALEARQSDPESEDGRLHYDFEKDLRGHVICSARSRCALPEEFRESKLPLHEVGSNRKAT